ncbi:MAG: hypothetical protein ABL986_05990 [Vicinamibacterales bacterium]
MTEDQGEYCRQVEAYLCRKNDGHLIRIVGPAFEAVCGWAARGVPFAIACQGIDRYCERYYAKAGRRRPVQIQFCEADVLDLFDHWRRTVGISRVSETDADFPEPGEQPRHGSLSAHLERAIARLTALRGSFGPGDEAIDRVVRELDTVRASARGARGAAREALLDRLRDIDVELLACARDATPHAEMAALTVEAEGELAPFRERMPPDALARAIQTTVDRLLRMRARLPEVAFD